jgi:hypothetical protein
LNMDKNTGRIHYDLSLLEIKFFLCFNIYQGLSSPYPAD